MVSRGSRSRWRCGQSAQSMGEKARQGFEHRTGEAECCAGDEQE